MTGFANSEPVRRNEPHHYVFDHYECPVCGKSETHRTRVAGPKPEPTEKDPYPTHRWAGDRQSYDYCDVL